jgi:hypothetical protein
MNEDEAALHRFIQEFRKKFMELPFEDVAFPRGVKGLSKYRDASAIYKSATPIQVKGSLIFNHMLVKHGINSIPPIMDGDKIKFAYLKTPNIIGETVIATADYIPAEFNLDKYIDRDMQFDKAFLEPLKAITEVIGWQVEQKATLEEFFS